jgi:hypothetical protein
MHDSMTNNRSISSSCASLAMRNRVWAITDELTTMPPLPEIKFFCTATARTLRGAKTCSHLMISTKPFSSPKRSRKECPRSVWKSKVYFKCNCIVQCTVLANFQPYCVIFPLELNKLVSTSFMSDRIKLLLRIKTLLPT